jgi:hypothetical protein
MHKASLRMTIGLAFLLSTVMIAQAADPGTEDPNNWPQYNRTANAALQSARPEWPSHACLARSADR